MGDEKALLELSLTSRLWLIHLLTKKESSFELSSNMQKTMIFIHLGVVMHLGVFSSDVSAKGYDLGEYIIILSISVLSEAYMYKIG